MHDHDNCSECMARETALRETIAQAWDEGHRHLWKRGPDECMCGAWASMECACGKYGTGELLSLNDNPYRRGQA